MTKKVMVYSDGRETALRLGARGSQATRELRALFQAAVEGKQTPKMTERERTRRLGLACREFLYQW
jgi:hypothetical protein